MGRIGEAILEHYIQCSVDDRLQAKRVGNWEKVKRIEADLMTRGISLADWSSRSHGGGTLWFNSPRGG